MPNNVGYLVSKRDAASDELYTPLYAVKPLVKYLPKNAVVWCPFDQEWSAFNEILSQAGHKVVLSHIDNGQDFFDWEPDEYDIIISNPPYSKKDLVFKRLDELGKPFAMLVPVPTLQGQKRFKYLKDIQYLGFDKRINFFKDPITKEVQKSTPFGSCYLCKKLLPRDLIIEELIKE